MIQNGIRIRPEGSMKETLNLIRGRKTVFRQDKNIIRVVEIVGENMSVIGDQFFER